MDNRHKWFFTALAAGSGTYVLVEANESVRNLLAVIAFLVFYLIGEIELGKVALKDTNKMLWDRLQILECKIERMERDREGV